MPFETKLAEWSAIYVRLQAAQMRLRRALETGDAAQIETSRVEVAAIQGESDECIRSMDTVLKQRGRSSGDGP